jgi:cytidine deaminase
MTEEHSINISYTTCEVIDLPEQEQMLVKLAAEAEERAYAVYSGFRVGAAVLLDSGEIVTGNNQENVAYPSGLCAERVALFSAMSRFPQAGIQTIAVTVDAERFQMVEPVPPCGACRQVMAEYEIRQQSPIKVLLAGKNGKVICIRCIVDLLPFMFQADGLKLT